MAAGCIYNSDKVDSTQHLSTLQLLTRGFDGVLVEVPVVD